MRSQARDQADAILPADDPGTHRRKTRAAALSIASNAVLIAFKLVVGLLSGSIAIISEALHSGSDLAAALIAFWSVRQAARPPDERHHYGHEKVENLSGVIEALLIIAAAGVIIYEGVMKIIDGPAIDRIWLGVGVMVVSGVVNLFVSRRVLYPVARRTESAALEADAAHLMTDVYTSFGVAGGLLLVRVTGWEYFDPLIAIAVATLIIHTGYRLVTESTRVLLDETLPADELELIRACVREHRGDLITDYHKLRARRAGSRRHVDLHVVVDPSLTVAEAHDIAEHIEEDIRTCLRNTDVLVHIEPQAPHRSEGD
ncbi:MAG TPA: cation diffusion facilitator family transporter [Thermoleophilia bacterium]|nr:cation diffusion facilitator family transporter [Acidobacteriota bacterium]HQH21679.1 cation diffusion facilitator family transporter [Thermoleophilia bacterium]